MQTKMGHVATVKTVATPAEVLGAFIYVLPGGFSRVGVDMIAAQSAIETANWKSMHNWNAGNTTPSASQVAAGVDWMDQGLPMKYLAFPNLVAGCRNMVDWLSKRGALPYANSGDLGGYMGRLQSSCYLGCVGQTDPTGHTVSQADYDGYQSGIASRMATLASVVPVLPSWWSTLTGLDYALLGAAGAGAAACVALLARPDWVSSLIRD